MANPSETSVLDALSSKKVAAVQAAIDAGGAVDATDGYQRTALHEAINMRSKPIALCLLNAGANPNLRESNHWSALDLALEVFPNEELLGALLDKGALIDEPDTEELHGYRPVHRAVRGKDTRALILLLDRGASIDAPSVRKQLTALHYACQGEKGLMSPTAEEAAALLIEHGANVDALTASMATPLHCAAQSGSFKTVKLLLGRKAKLLRTKQGATALHWSISTHDKLDDVWNALIAAGIDVNSQDDSGQTALHTAQSASNLHAVKFFLKHGADKSLRDKEGKTALDGALELKQAKLIPLLK